jgi:arsenite-transporting ATPase
MSDIEVEAVDSIESGASEEDTVDESAVPAGVDAPEYVLYGGKGGVGKTTCAAATALASANDGTATLVVSTDPSHSLSDILETPIPNEPTRISDEHPLYGVEIDPDAAESPFEQGMGDIDDLFGEMGGMSGPNGMNGTDGMTDGMGMGFGTGGMTDGMSMGFGTDGIDEGMDMGMGMSTPGMDSTATVGSDEMATMQLLLEYLDDSRFERVVVDTAPTGHTLRLLSLPEIMDSMAGQLLSFRERMQGMLGNMPGPFGDETAGEEMDQLEAFSDRIERLRAALRDPERTEFRVVMVPEQLSVIESERLLRRLEDFDISTGTVIVNRVTEDITQVTDVEADWIETPNPEECEFCQQRWQSQQEAIQRAQDVFQSRDIKRVPLFASEVRGPAMLQVVATCLD